MMLAINHGYFQGPTTGLERVDLSIIPLLGHADALMTTRRMVRFTIPPASDTPIVLRASGGPSILKGLSDEQTVVSMEDAARINASAVAMQVFICGEFETQSVCNMTRLVDQSQRYGIPVLTGTAVGNELIRDARYLRLATRICAELGAHVVKSYYCAEDFDTVTAARYRSSWPTARSFLSLMPSRWPIALSRKGRRASTWAGIPSRAITRSRSARSARVAHEALKPQAAYGQFLRRPA